jgi:hypothetical protein
MLSVAAVLGEEESTLLQVIKFSIYEIGGTGRAIQNIVRLVLSY